MCVHTVNGVDKDISSLSQIFSDFLFGARKHLACMLSLHSDHLNIHLSTNQRLV